VIDPGRAASGRNRRAVRFTNGAFLGKRVDLGELHTDTEGA
jgi:hypothetical protein